MLPLTRSVLPQVKAVCDEMSKYRLVEVVCEVEGGTVLGEAKRVCDLSLVEKNALVKAFTFLREYFLSVYEGIIFTSRNYARKKKEQQCSYDWNRLCVLCN